MTIHQRRNLKGSEPGHRGPVAIPPSRGPRRWSLELYDRHRIPTPKPFVFYADHDDWITFYANRRRHDICFNINHQLTMGAWDATSFGNDTANDWAYDLEERDDLSYIESTLQQVLDTGDEYLDSHVATEAIAAAEVLAWLRDRPTPVNAYTEKIAAWVSAHPIEPPAAIIQKALSALDRIQRQPSELPELWDGDPGWTASIADLCDRLTS